MPKHDEHSAASRRDAAQDSRDSNAHFTPFLDTIIDATGIGLWDWNLATGEVIYSRQWEIIAGHDPGTLPQVVSSWEEALFPEDLQKAENAIQAYLDGKTPRYECEFRMRRPDGTIIWAQDKGTITEWNADGTPSHLVGVIQDISGMKRAQEKLREQTEQLDFVAGMAGLGRWEWDITRDHISYDNYYLEMIGYTEDEVDGSFTEWEAFCHPDDLPDAIAALDACIRGEITHYAHDIRMRHKDGHYIWTRDVGRVAAWDTEGNPTRVLGGHLNIDQQKQNELRLEESLQDNERANVRLQYEVDKAFQSLRETQQFSDAMFNANPYINIIFDDQLNLMDCNPAAMEYFGFETKEALLENLLPLINSSIPAFQPDGSPSTPLSARFDYVLEHGFIEFEVELVLSGKRVPMRFTLKKLTHKDTFAIAGYLVDMHSIKEARNELLRQDYLLRQVNRAATRLMSAEPESFDRTIHKVLRSLGRSVNASRMYIWENYEERGQLFCRELYLWDTDARGRAPKTFSGGLDYRLIPDWFEQLKANKTISLQVKELDDDLKALLLPRNAKAVMLIPVFFMEAFWGFIGLDKSNQDALFTPIEEKVIQSGGILIVSAILRNQINQNLIIAREAAMASDKAKSEFLSRMSHEIRTPMNAIIGMTAIAKKSDDMERVQYSLDRIEVASSQLLEIINDILDMSKIESGRFEITPVAFDLEQMVKNVCQVVQVRIDEKQQNFAIDFENLFTRQVVCDELRLSQVMINLLTNAIKFTPEGGDIAVKIGCQPGKDGTQMLHVEVRDTGIGMTPEQQSRLFRSFEQADGSITRRFGGTGLGLAICKRITNLMGGDIWVNSAEGKGSTFTFEVTFEWGASLAEEKGQRTLRSNLRVLVADDSEDIRIAFGNILDDFGVEYELAASGNEAVQRVHRAQREGRPYDVVLLDWRMPGMSGTEAAGEIKKVMDDQIIVVMFSGASWDEIREEAQTYGVSHFLPKPVLPSTLYDTLVQLTGARYTAEMKPVLTGGPDEATYRWPGKHVLIVEDMDINREIIQAILEETEMSLDSAENGLIAVEKFTRNPDLYDIILMDVQMPELDGLGATRRIRAMDLPRAKTIPIIAMTANAFSEDVEKCLAAGMNDHIAKPIDVEAMMKKLATYLSPDIPRA